MTKDLKMVCIVPYNLSPIQQGIQAAHAIVEYQRLHNSRDYSEWATNHKTILVKNGGTTGPNGSLQSILRFIQKTKTPYATFKEPDINNALTAIAVLVDYNCYNELVYELNTLELA